MKNKKVVAMFLAGVMSLGCLAGCGEKETVPSKTKTSSEVQKESETVVVESTEEVAELEEKTIQLWLRGNKQQDSEKVWVAFNEKLQEYVPNTTVEITVMPSSEYPDNFTRMLASGEAVDLAFAADWVTGSFADHIEDGDLMPLSDLLDEYGQGIKDTLTEKVVEMHRYSDGELYYLINWQGLAANRRGIYVITELAELAGDTWTEDLAAALNKWWNTKSTPDDFKAVLELCERYLEAATAAGKGGAGLKWNEFMGWGYRTNLCNELASVNNVGVENQDDSFTVVDGIATENYKAYAEFMANLYKKGYIPKDSASVDMGTFSFMTEGKLEENTWIMYQHNALGSMMNENLSTQRGADWQIIPIEADVELIKGEGATMVIPYCSDEPERAMMVLNVIYSVPELYQTLIWGIEGEHWTDNGDGTVNFTGGTGSSATYGLYNWIIGSCVNSLTTQTMVPRYYEDLYELEQEAKIHNFLDFTFVSTGLEDVVAALTAVDAEYEPQIYGGYHGDDWETVYNKWLAERKAAGVDKLIAEYQRQLNEYIVANNITSFK